MESKSNRRSLWWWSVFLLMVTEMAQAGVYTCSTRESKALLSLKGNDTFNALPSWKEGSDCCNHWAGVTCDHKTGNVIGVSIPTSPYTISTDGLISADLCYLNKLQILEISDYFQGRIPACLWNMTRLEYLVISYLNIPGSLGSQVCNLRDLRQLLLPGNSLIGGLPACIWSMPKLQILDLTESIIVNADLNSVSPVDVHAPLREIHLSGTSISGALPEWMADLPLLELLDVSNNSITAFPGKWSGDASQSLLRHLDASFNTIARLPSLCSLSRSLTWLSLGNNRLNRLDIGATCTFAQLSTLYLVGNAIQEVPASFNNFPNLLTLYLSDNQISGLSDASLCGMSSSLTKLLLSGNKVSRFDIAAACTFTNLSLLDLNGNAIREVPASFNNFPNLLTLDLSDNQIAGLSDASLCGMSSSLAKLVLSGNNVSRFDVGAACTFTNLSELYLDGNAIREVSASFSNFPNLVTLELSDNQISGLSNASLCGMSSSLAEPESSGNNVSRIDFGSACNFTALSSLNLHGNAIGEVPTSFGYFPNLGSLDLSFNQIAEISSRSFRNFPNLVSLDLSFNQIAEISDGSLCGMSNSLISLFLSHNRLNKFDIGDQCNFRQLVGLDLANNNMSGHISFSMRGSSFPSLSSLNIANNHFSGELPAYFYNRGFFKLNVSGNQLSGSVSDFNWGDTSGQLDLSWNKFGGPLPSFSNSTFEFLALSNNNFTGPIPPGLANSTSMAVLDLSFNQLSGSVPAFLGILAMGFLTSLDLSSNRFTGGLPSLVGLHRFHAGFNLLSGNIPDTIGGAGSSLYTLSLRHNRLEGEIPSSLGNCSGLVVLDLSYNCLTGTIPSTLRNLSSSLQVLVLKSNQLSGEFPFWIVDGNFTPLHVLDLSNNQFWGKLPASYSTLHGFISTNGARNSDGDTLYYENIQISTSGLERNVTYVLSSRTSFDVSSNHFSGPIPDQLSELRSLLYLNLSFNNFNATIPNSLSKLTELDCLDLSSNELTGQIPQDLCLISRMSYFSVSNNRLSGRIPTDAPFSTFNRSQFENNTDLCGYPLDKCPSGEDPRSNPPDSHGHRFHEWISLNSFFASFVTSFLATFSVFLCSERARSYLYVPRERTMGYGNPYGAYVPRE